jgi:glyoxylase I family protein
MVNTQFAHIGIACENPIEIERFYTKHFGFKRARVVPLGEEQIVFIKSGNVYLELFQAKEESPVPKARKDGPMYPSLRHLAFTVDDVDEKIEEMGDDADVTLGPLDFSDFILGWKGAWLADPEGNIIEISQGYVDEDNPPPLE